MATKPAFSYNTPSFAAYRTRLTGVFPYKTPVDHISFTAFAGSKSGTGFEAISSQSLAWLQNTADPVVAGFINQAYARAFDKIVGKVQSEFSVNLGETLGEGREAIGMMAKRIEQLARAYGHLRRFAVKDMLREFGYRPRKVNQTWVRVGKGGKIHSFKNERVELSEAELKHLVKTPAQVWLEYHLGWSPIVSEVYNSMQQAHAVHPLNFNDRVSVTGTVSTKHWSSDTEHSYWKGGTVRNIVKAEAKYSCRLTVTVKISSPLKKKFADNGVVNPVLIAWNLAPGSMFIDWFLSVSKWLNGYTAFYGTKLSDLTAATKRTASQEISVVYSSPSYSHQNDSNWNRASRFERRYTPEDVSLRVPGLFDRTAGGAASSVARAATAISVLIGFLRS